MKKPALLLAACLAASCADEAAAPEGAPAPAPTPAPSTEVDPFVGSGGMGFAHGSAFPGAVAPNGLAKVGPDTKGPYGTILFLHYSGYWYGDDHVRGFSHLHLHGTGATDMGVVSLMPTDGFDETRTDVDGYESPFRKETEHASPGRYGVTLDRGGIRVELAATEHGAIHRWTWPEGATEAWAIVDLDRMLGDGEVTAQELALDAASSSFRGRLHARGGMSGGFGGYDVFFAARVSRPWREARVWGDDGVPAPGAGATGDRAGAALSFDPAGGPVEVALAVSLVDEGGAARNLEAELPAFDLEGTAAATAAAWDEVLGKVAIEGGTPEERTLFYTSLYHAYLMPTAISDVDGRWRAPDGTTATATGRRQLSDFSLWDTYRTVHPLYGLLDHRAARESVESLHAFAEVAGFFPKWPIATGEASTMIGASAEIVLGDAASRGVEGPDYAGAYRILRAAALDDADPPGGRGGRNDVMPYMAHGYVPASVSRSVSKTTEYAHDDYGLARLAAHLGETDDAALLDARSKGYRALFDPETRFLRPRFEDGTLAGEEPFDPLAFDEAYVEANAWHSVWMAAHDVEGFVALFGGQAAMIDHLETFFEGAKAEWDGLPADDLAARALPRPYYWHGNEPDIHAPFLFAQAGRPDLTQRWARWVADELYAATPDGLAGNDDGGTLGAWWVLAALGLYPVPGGDLWILGAPRFPRATLSLPSGATLVIEAEGASAEAIYVQSVTLDGAPLERAELRHGQLAGGGTLRFVMGPAPSAWGRL